MPAECEIDKCGVLAIGRCVTCRRAFCQSHQLFGLASPIVASAHGPVTNFCAWCGGLQQAEYWREREDANPLGYGGRVLGWFREAGLVTEPFHHLDVQRDYRRRKWVETVTIRQIGVGWVLGECPWSRSVSEVAYEDVPYLTVLTDYEHPDWCPNGYGYNYGRGYANGLVAASRGDDSRLISYGHMGCNTRTFDAANRLVNEIMARVRRNQ